MTDGTLGSQPGQLHLRADGTLDSRTDTPRNAKGAAETITESDGPRRRPNPQVSLDGKASDHARRSVSDGRPRTLSDTASGNEFASA